MNGDEGSHIVDIGKKLELYNESIQKGVVIDRPKIEIEDIIKSKRERSKILLKDLEQIRRYINE